LMVKLPSVSIVMPCVRVAAMMFLRPWDGGALSEGSHAEHSSKLAAESLWRWNEIATGAE
jgi:hypothetical protein